MKQKNTTILFLLLIVFTTASCDKKKDDTPPPTPDTGTVTDIEGNVYKTIKIGTQVWMAENLKVTKYRNGESIAFAGSKTTWAAFALPKLPGYCNSNDSAATVAVYGRLYNWRAVIDSRGLAPAGWHVPSLDEWLALMTFLGGKSAAGGKMKEAGTAHWLAPNNADNSSGFAALFVKTRNYNGDFWGENPVLSENYAYWWTSTVVPDNITPDSRAYWAFLFNKSTTAYTGGDFQNYGLSVRCVKN
jgi:uncharacterized protein (TIGR02145 family)